MKNVKSVLSGLRYDDWEGSGSKRDHVQAVCEAKIAPFTGAHITRNHLVVDVLTYDSEMVYMQSGSILEIFKGFTGFRTVVFCLYSGAHYLVLRDEDSQNLKKTMEPTLGPATEGFSWRALEFTFNPRKQRVDA